MERSRDGLMGWPGNVVFLGYFLTDPEQHEIRGFKKKKQISLEIKFRNKMFQLSKWGWNRTFSGQEKHLEARHSERGTACAR